jgi:hypothetical protein
MYLLFIWRGTYTVKKVIDFPVFSRDATNQEFGYWHPGWGRENRKPFFTFWAIWAQKVDTVSFNRMPNGGKFSCKSIFF